MANNSPNKPIAGLRFPIRGMTPENGCFLMDALRELYGEAAEDMTVSEVMERHPDLIAKLDGERGFVDGQPISDESMIGLTYQSELNHAVGGERARIMEIDEKGRLKLPEEL